MESMSKNNAQLNSNLYMLRCIELAKKAGKATKTNPLVGAVVVYNDRIIGEGYYEIFGGAHAEVNAINSVKKEHIDLLKDATLYVSLEPCCIYAKTPPCTNKIIESGIKHVVIGCLDPNEKMNGKSIEILKQHDIKVELSSYEKEAKFLINKFKANLKNKPYIILKWAQSYDNFIGHQSKQLWLTNESSKMLSHKWRTEVDGILIGKNTALIDNPQLTARLYEGDNPIRILLDTHLTVPKHYHLFTDGNKTKVFNKIKAALEKNVEYVMPGENLDNILQTLYSHGIYNVIVEGGSTILKSFIENNLWDEARIFKTQYRLLEDHNEKELIVAPSLEGKLLDKKQIGDDELIIVQPKL